jgi:hypothetical protein
MWRLYIELLVLVVIAFVVGCALGKVAVHVLLRRGAS